MAGSIDPRRTAKAKRSARIRRTLFSTLVVLAVFVILYFFILRGAGDVSLMENGIGSLVTRVQLGARSVIDSVGRFFGSFGDNQALLEENEALRVQNELLSIQLSGYDALEAENDAYKALLGVQTTYESLSPVYAKVIARESGVWTCTFSINKGSLAGIRTNMAVVNADGLIGRIYEVGYNYAKVMCLIDTRSSIACLIGRTRDNGVLRGQTDVSSAEASSHMYYIPASSSVRPGDAVYTSGVDTVFPKGLYVGTVTAVSREADSAKKYVVVSPAADFLHIEHVFVLRQTVESDREALPVVPTPTPRPIVTPSTKTKPTPTPRVTGLIDDHVWTYPSALPSASVSPSVTPTPTATALPPEAAWLDR